MSKHPMSYQLEHLRINIGDQPIRLLQADGSEAAPISGVGPWLERVITELDRLHRLEEAVKGLRAHWGCQQKGNELEAALKGEEVKR